MPSIHVACPLPAFGSLMHPWSNPIQSKSYSPIMVCMDYKQQARPIGGRYTVQTRDRTAVSEQTRGGFLQYKKGGLYICTDEYGKTSACEQGLRSILYIIRMYMYLYEYTVANGAYTVTHINTNDLDRDAMSPSLMIGG